MNFMLANDLDDGDYALKFAKCTWEPSKGNFVVARWESYCNLYKTTFKSSKSSVISNLDDSTISVKWWHHGHTMVNNKGKIGALQGGFSGRKIHDVKEKVMQEGENSLHKSKVHELVKLFKDKFTLNEEWKLIV